MEDSMLDKITYPATKCLFAISDAAENFYLTDYATSPHVRWCRSIHDARLWGTRRSAEDWMRWHRRELEPGCKVVAW